MHTLTLVLFSILGVVLVGIPTTAVAVTCRDDLHDLGVRLRRALAFDPRHPALSHQPVR